ncbi:MAG: cell division protein ZapA [Rhodoferax sp.]|uniref:cell division protein ZapA n=1 Tax=Rhodoferax sp. TaxID=50421 RepID=UPI0008CCDF70|nr:cell division protein ZapA [Rhodoferax sp.]MDP2679801.1 cell division protein ZapA [Rhodoferax sp.]OGB50417.1 MAG: cell division protein ZapA [Burkholderiales bacterium RIFOXYD12_FULL_59_19]
MKQLEVQIMGQSYLLGCPEGGEARLRQVASRVDEAMCKIREAGKVRSRDRIAVLAALNLAFDTPEPVAAPTPDLLTFAALPTDESNKFKQLLQRLDAALTSDDQLL